VARKRNFDGAGTRSHSSRSIEPLTVRPAGGFSKTARSTGGMHIGLGPIVGRDGLLPRAQMAVLSNVKPARASSQRDYMALIKPFPYWCRVSRFDWRAGFEGRDVDARGPKFEYRTLVRADAQGLCRFWLTRGLDPCTGAARGGHRPQRGP